jgi:hypothetical protein
MAKKATTAQKITPQQLERDAVNREGEAKREKEKKDRQANAEKQRRYRKSMKAQGYHAVLTWEKPLPPDMVKVSAIIHKNSLNIADQEDSGIRNAMRNFCTEIFMMQQNKEISNDVYRDILSLLKPLGNDGL